MSKRKLLLADDSITIQKVVNLTFADEGIEVVTAGDGDSAMKKFVETQPDLVMADVNMPGVDGYKICEMIKQDDETKDIPVILLVGSFEPFDEDEARRVGADDYLTKPFQSIRQLVNKVSALLDTSNGQVNDFSEDNTLKMPQKSFEEGINEIAEAQLGDAGMDDDIIQTSQLGVYSFADAKSSETNYENQFEDEQLQTKPLSVEEISAITADSSFDENPSGRSSDYINEPEFGEEEQNSQTEAPEMKMRDDQNYYEQNSADKDESYRQAKNPEVFSSSDDFSGLDFDELDLLELPLSHSKGSYDEEPEEEAIEIYAEPETADEPEEHPEPAAEDTGETKNYSPELIQAIAEKITENITIDVMKEIAKEVAPQVASLLVKRMTEELKKQ